MSALLVRPDGTHEVVSGDVRSIKFLYAQIDCTYFEAVYLEDSMVAWLDEEGALTPQKPVNYAASLVLSTLGKNVGMVRGNVLLTGMKGEDNEPLTDKQLNLLHAILEDARPHVERFNNTQR